MDEYNPHVYTSSLHILVVDDDDADREASIQVIKENGHYADGVASGEEAVEATYRTPYDLAFMDIDMPGGMNGFETTKTIRSLPETRGMLPIIALTMTKNPEDVRECIMVGMSNFVLKPLTKSNFLAAVGSYAVRKRKIF